MSIETLEPRLADVGGSVSREEEHSVGLQVEVARATGSIQWHNCFPGLDEQPLRREDRVEHTCIHGKNQLLIARRQPLLQALQAAEAVPVLVVPIQFQRRTVQFGAVADDGRLCKLPILSSAQGREQHESHGNQQQRLELVHGSRAGAKLYCWQVSHRPVVPFGRQPRPGLTFAQTRRPTHSFP